LAHSKGILSDKEYGDLVKAHLQQQIDGGAGAKVEADAQKPTLEDAAVQAIKDGKDVQASTSDGDGKQKSVSVAFAMRDSDAGAVDGGTASSGFDIGNGQEIVDAFKAVFAGNDRILAHGQFNVSDTVKESIHKIIDDKAATDPDLKQAWKAAKKTDDADAQRKAVKKYLDTNNLNERYPEIKALVQNHTGPSVQQIFGDFWVPDEIKPKLKFPKPTFDLLVKSFDWEKKKCGFVAQLLGNKMVKKLGKKLPPSMLFDQEGILQVTIKPDNLPTNSGKRQELTYSPDQLKKIMGKVDTCLDARRPVVAGVMSGANHVDNGVPFVLKPKPQCEHYILIFGYDGNRYFFWDPDDQRSNIQQQNWGPSFGVLFYKRDGQNDRLTTAFNDTDLINIESGTGDDDGDHIAVKTRHRYEVYYLRSGLSFDIKGELKYDPKTGKAT
jgi:hypothetical protein